MNTVATTVTVLKARKAGYYDGAAGKKPAPAAVAATAGDVAAYMVGHAKGWFDAAALNFLMMKEAA